MSAAQTSVHRGRRQEFTTEQRAEYRAQKRAESRELIESAARELLTSEGWQRYAEVRASFHRYSANNCMLIAMQRPDASRVAGFRKWQELGRQVRKGERSIRILAPHTAKRTSAETGEEETHTYFRAVPVFDVGQTDGEPLPEQPCHRLTGDDPHGAFQRLQSVAMNLGFSVVITDDLPVGVNGDCSHMNKCIRVRRSNAPAQQAKTLAHELAHAILHERYDDRALAECEAESVAYVVTADLGLDSSQYSFGYIAGWAGGADDARAAIAASGNAIQLAVKTILSSLERQEAA